MIQMDFASDNSVDVHVTTRMSRENYARWLVDEVNRMQITGIVRVLGKIEVNASAGPYFIFTKTSQSKDWFRQEPHTKWLDEAKRRADNFVNDGGYTQAEVLDWRHKTVYVAKKKPGTKKKAKR